MKKDNGQRSIINPNGETIEIPCIEKIKSVIIEKGIFGKFIRLEYYPEAKENANTKPPAKIPA